MTTKQLIEKYKKATRYAKNGKLTPAEFNLLTKEYFINKVNYRDFLDATLSINNEETLIEAVQTLITLTNK
jgi:hypothetical protein